jgi:hypothetical protein
MAETKELILETVEWSSLSHVDELEPISNKDTEVLDAVREVLVQHGYCDRFGITLLHRHFPLADDEINVEATDEESRVSTTKPYKRRDVSESGAIQTQWRFKMDGPQAVTVCEAKCFSVGSVSHNQKHVPTAR